MPDAIGSRVERCGSSYASVGPESGSRMRYGCAAANALNDSMRAATALACSGFVIAA